MGIKDQYVSRYTLLHIGVSTNSSPGGKGEITSHRITSNRTPKLDFSEIKHLNLNQENILGQKEGPILGHLQKKLEFLLSR